MGFFKSIRQTIKNVTSQPMEVTLKSMPAVKNAYLRVSESLQDKDKQLQSLKRAYFGALAVVAILSILSDVATFIITNKEKENAEVTFSLTKMWSLVDTAVAQAKVFKTSGDPFDDNLLTTSLDTLKEESANIEAYGDDATKEMFQSAPYFLKANIAGFVKTAEDFLHLSRTGKHTEAATAFTALSGPSSESLKINLNLAHDQFRTDILAELHHEYQLQLVGLAVILLVLSLEALFIFGPLVKHLGEYHKYLIKLALTDMLTGLNNRRAFIQLANAGLDYYRRHKKPFVLVLMDLDHFKTVNDTYGHKVGDLVLQHYSALMQKTLRAHDTLGRIGGEEFAIFLPQITPEEAQPLIERFRKRVAETPCTYVDGSGESKSLGYSSSFGAVSVSEGVWTLDELFIRADEQLYKAKEQGRNCVVLKTLKKPPAAT